jgi:tetratricopeptide (TPR) repeat protein
VDSSYLTQAILECEQAMENRLDNPENWQKAFRNLGNLLQGMGQFERAIVWHSLALEHQPNLVEVYAQLGELYIGEDNWSGALKSFETALKHQPNSVQIYASLAQIHGKLQQREAEMECWYRATELDPNLVNPQGYYKLAKAFEEKGELEKAIIFYQRASEGEKFFILASYDLGEMYLRQSKLELAHQTYEKILAAAPDEARAQYKLGTIYLQKKRFEEAIDYFRQTIKNAPEFPWAYRDLVKTFLQLQKWDEAIATCYAILNLVEEYPWVYVQLGDALRGKGRIAEAAANFQKACASRGWQECIEHDYFFTNDIFSYRIPQWETHLQFLSQRENLQVLQVGCFEGMSACWLLDRILIHPQDKLTCIEPKLTAKFKENLAKTEAESKVTLLEGDTHQLMASLTPDSFDLVNLQDKRKLTTHAQKNAALAWQLLNTGGVIVFNDYGWSNPGYPEQNPTQGIEQFLDSVKGQWEIIHRAFAASQLMIRKK